MNSSPIIVYEYNRKLSNLISINIIQEDRRPDLTEDEARVKLGYKYKTQIEVVFFMLKYSFIFHTLTVGFIYENKKSLNHK